MTAHRGAWIAVWSLLAIAPAVAAQSAYVRVSQAGYEAGASSMRAYLMSAVAETGANFSVRNSSGNAVYSAAIGALLGTWSNSATLTYSVYAVDFTGIAAGAGYTIAVTGPAPAVSPAFAVDTPAALYSGLMLNTLFFYETQRDGAGYIPNALRSAPGHLNDAVGRVYATPRLNSDDLIDTTVAPLGPTGAVIDASGGWWDAGDYMKYVETMSYAVALQEIGVRDFPNQMGPHAPLHPPAPPNAISYAGSATGAPVSSNFLAESRFGIQFLMKMWDDTTKTLYYQVGNSQSWSSYPNLLTDYDIWRLPQADDTWDGCNADAYYICRRPVFAAGPSGSPVSPNLAGRLAAAFAVCYQLNHAAQPALANQCLLYAEDVFALADTSFADPAPSVGSGSCSGCLLTILPFDGYPETVWDDDMELGATELYFALEAGAGHLPPGLPVTNPMHYLTQAAQFASNYITRIYEPGYADTLNLYDVSGLAHFELYRALKMAGNPGGLPVSQASMRAQLLAQVGAAVAQAGTDAWGFGDFWNNDTASHGAGISVMASEAFYLTGASDDNLYSQRWLANILGANPWGSSFIVGAGSSTFPNCIQHQVANLAGSLNGTSGGVPVLWGAVSEGPSQAATAGALDGMLLCPAGGGDSFKIFNGNDGTYNRASAAIYRDNVQSYSTTEPAIDLTATSFLMWSWRMAGRPGF